jgi:alkyl sulfatase BDS1-like metallo-beta-lactamase superfamily hydrolase
MPERAEATRFTREANAAVLEQLPFSDTEDFDDARRGLIAPLAGGGVLRNEHGWTFWDPERFAFVEPGSEAPDTVNPSLWRQAQLVLEGGLFKVTERIYQVRNQDISNMTIVEGDEGLIVIDPLISAETARAALDLYCEHRERRPVTAVIYSHSHVDHFGGVRGVIDSDDVEAGRVRVISPAGFLEAAVSENVIAGNAMARRALYMFGTLLEPSPKGQVGVGLGLTTSLGQIGLIAPTEEITHTGQRLEVDGVEFEFLLAPDTEAPAEMHWFIESERALTAAENCCHTLHNTYTLRGAPIRDPRAWSRYLNETAVRWADRADVLYGMHHWPVWGRDRVGDLLRASRDAYRYINDQTLRLANHGHTAPEIAELVQLPDGLARRWALRGYYGTVNHNVKAAYVKYLGAYDGNPANLHPLPPEEAARRYVDAVGGAERLLELGREAYERGEYRWVAELVNHLVFADPQHREARELQAGALEQLGYQAESGAWRNSYLTGAQELRHGTPDLPGARLANPDILRAMSLGMCLDYVAVRIDGPRAAEHRLAVNLELTDTGESAALELANGALSHALGHALAEPDASVRMTRATLDRLVAAEAAVADAVAAGEIQADPDASALEQLLDLVDEFRLWFNIVEP